MAAFGCGIKLNQCTDSKTLKILKGGLLRRNLYGNEKFWKDLNEN